MIECYSLLGRVPHAEKCNISCPEPGSATELLLGAAAVCLAGQLLAEDMQQTSFADPFESSGCNG